MPSLYEAAAQPSSRFESLDNLRTVSASKRVTQTAILADEKGTR